MRKQIGGAKVRRDSVDLVSGQGEDAGKTVGRIRLVRGKLVTEGGEWVKDLVRHPAGRWPDLVPPNADPLVFLAALVKQYDGSGLRAQWSPA